jgi:hypothetical protein
MNRQLGGKTKCSREKVKTQKEKRQKEDAAILLPSDFGFLTSRF